MSTNNTKSIEARMEELMQKRAAKRRETPVELTAAQIKRAKAEEPSEPQLRQLRQFRVPEDEIAGMSKYDASEALDLIFAEIARRNAEPASKKMLQALVKWGFEMADIKDFTMGQARTLLNKVAPPLKRDDNYVSKNPIWKAAKLSGK